VCVCVSYLNAQTKRVCILNKTSCTSRSNIGEFWRFNYHYI